MTIAEFRERIRAFLADNLPPEMARRNLGVNYSSRADMLSWTAILARQGWSVPHWPVEYGGTGWSALERHVFEEECFLAGAPRRNVQAVSLVGPVIYTFGSDDQKKRYLPDIVEGRAIWAQGFSEPEAGSDLASLRTRAERDGDHYLVNGQKIWTTEAHISDMIFCLVRTDPNVKAQHGISFLLVPSRAPGITIRQIPSIDGHAHLCETFFEDVRVPAGNLVGEPGAGWTYAKFLLGNERSSVAELPRNKRNLIQLRHIAERTQVRGRQLLDDVEFASRLARLEMDLHALESSVIHGFETVDLDGLTTSSIKIRGTELLKAGMQLQFEALGPAAAIELPDPGTLPDEARDALPAPEWAPGVTSDFLYAHASAIYGGTNEIQRNILAKGILSETNAPRDEDQDDQRLLRESIRRFIATECDPDRMDAGATGGPALRARFAEAGWLGLTLRERDGGFGMTAAEACILLEELGGALVFEPSMASHLFAVEVLRDTDSDPARALRADLASGTASAAVAYEEADGGGRADWLSTRAASRADGWTIEGEKVLVLDASRASHLILWARTDGAAGPAADGQSTLFLVETSRPGIAFRDYRLLDGRPASNVAFSGLEVGRGDLLSPEGSGLPILAAAIDHATVYASAEALGQLDAAFRITRDYLLVRKQFGRRLADFQALQHRLADMFVQIDQARAMLRMAVRSLRDGDARERTELVSATKATLGRVAKFVGAQSIQLHGGIGMTGECRIGRYYKALLTCESLFGNEAAHLARFREARRRPMPNADERA
jgi:acyl-CoA dehydrogenase